jgi:hypothetical protein
MPNSQVDVTAGAPNLESYTDNGDGTVTDNVTGLMWQQAVPATTYTWANAVAYCPNADPRRSQRLAPPVGHRAGVHRGPWAVQSKHKRHVFPLDTGKLVLVFVAVGRLVVQRVDRRLLLRLRRHNALGCPANTFVRCVR